MNGISKHFNFTPTSDGNHEQKFNNRHFKVLTNSTTICDYDLSATKTFFFVQMIMMRVGFYLASKSLLNRIDTEFEKKKINWLHQAMQLILSKWWSAQGNCSFVYVVDKVKVKKKTATYNSQLVCMWMRWFAGQMKRP